MGDLMGSLFEHIKGTPKTFYNIGVGQRPHEEAEHLLSKFPGIEVFGTEPQYEIFVDRLRDYPGKLFHFGIWNQPTLKYLNLHEDFGSSSVLQSTELGLTAGIINEEAIFCIGLDDFDSLCGWKDDIFLWLDIEGAELEALKGARQLLYSGRVNWISIEANKQSRRIGDPSFESIKDYLEQYGFNEYVEYRGCDVLGDYLFQKGELCST